MPGMDAAMQLRAWIARNRTSRSPPIRLLIAAMMAARRAWLLATSPQARAILWLKVPRRGDVHQTAAVTWLDRYPDIFTRCASYFEGRPVRILSYGCATGEEVETLRRYFPDAILTGAEINAASLAACRSRGIAGDVAFIGSSRAAMADRAPYDAIFCMAVLQRTPHIVAEKGLTNLRRLYPFQRFDRQVGELDALLQPGGLLVIHHTQYLFADAAIARRYTPLDPPREAPAGELYFGRDSRRLAGPQRVASIFVKQRD